jgi:hypothetical protein
MRLSGILPVVGRRVMVALGVAVMLMVAASAQAQTAPAAQAQTAPAAPCQPQPPDPLRFDGAHPAIVLLEIKAPAETGFVESVGKLKDMLAASSNPKAQEMGTGMKIYKLNVPANNQDPAKGPVFIYLLHMDNPVKDQSYNPLCVFYYSGYFLPLNEKGEPGGTAEERKKVDDVYQPMVAAVANLVPWPLAVIKK